MPSSFVASAGPTSSIREKSEQFQVSLRKKKAEDLFSHYRRRLLKEADPSSLKEDALLKKFVEAYPQISNDALSDVRP